MQDFINQAEHNQSFHDKIHSEFPDHFNDWKITVLFYVAIHLLKTLAAKRKVDIGGTHEEIGKNIRPVQHGGNPKMPISETAYKNYKGLYEYSRTARYTGMKDQSLFEELMKSDHKHAVKKLYDFRRYVEGLLSGMS